MSTILLDTSVVIDTLNAKRNRPALLTQLLTSGHDLACCATTVSEIYAGMRPKEERHTTAFLQSLHFYEIDWETAELAGRLKFQWARKGKVISLADATIAAVAISKHLPLMTDNVKDFPMEEITFYNLAA